MAKAKAKIGAVGALDNGMAGRELVLGEYRGSPQKRTGRPSDWTQAKRDQFIEVLADSCNVSLAARAINRNVRNRRLGQTIYSQIANS